VSRIPIAAAKRIAHEYNLDQVVIFARKHGDNGTEHVTTFGKTVEDCDVAARMGNQLKRYVGWPEDLCTAKPARIRRKERTAPSEVETPAEALFARNRIDIDHHVANGDAK